MAKARMQEVGIEKIHAGANPRKDAGDLTELAASIREFGVLEPLILNEKMRLIVGHRRFAAAKAAGLKTVPVVVRKGYSPADCSAMAVVENIQRKDLTLLEEATVYDLHVRKQKMSVETFAKKLGKTPEYVERRLSLLKLAPAAQNALEEGKILLGHAIILARMDPANQNKQLKEIVSSKASVSAFAESMKSSWHGAAFKLAMVPFDKKECTGCFHNGGQQCILDETGTSLKGVCLKASCFMAKIGEWTRAEETRLKDKGVNVLSEKQARELLNKDAQTVESCHIKYDEIMKTRLFKEPKTFAVAFLIERGEVEKVLVCLKPQLLSGARSEEGEPSKKALGKSREARLKQRLVCHYRELAINTTRLLAKEQGLKVSLAQGTARPAKALAVYELLKKVGGRVSPNAVRSLVEEETKQNIVTRKGGDPWKGLLRDDSLPGLLRLPEPALDQLLARLPTLWLEETADDELNAVSKAFGFNVGKHFVVTEDFLKLYSINQLKVLAEELRVDVEGCVKKADHVQAIIAAAEKRKLGVPSAIKSLASGK